MTALEVRYSVVSKRQPYALVLLSPSFPTGIHLLFISHTSSPPCEQHKGYLFESRARIILQLRSIAGQSRIRT